jgi:hypothetical protein
MPASFSWGMEMKKHWWDNLSQNERLKVLADGMGISVEELPKDARRDTLLDYDQMHWEWQQLVDRQNRGTDINDLGLRLFGLLSEGKQLSPTIAKTLRKSLGGHKDWSVTGSEGEWYVQNENGELVGGPYDSRVVAEYEAENQIDADRIDMDNLFRGKGSQKTFQIEQTGDGGVQVTLNGQVVAGPFHSEDEVRQAMTELQSRGHTPIGKGWINWTLLSGGLAQGLDTPGGQIMAAAGAGGLFMETLLEVISFLRTGKYDFEEDKEEDY